MMCNSRNHIPEAWKKLGPMLRSPVVDPPGTKGSGGFCPTRGAEVAARHAATKAELLAELAEQPLPIGDNVKSPELT